MKWPEIDNEHELLLQLKQGTVGAFEQLYNRYKQPLAASLVKLLRNDTLAQDALQDLFVRVWNNRASIDPAMSFRSYLYRIAQNLVIDYYRKIAREKELMEVFLHDAATAHTTIDDALEANERKKVLQALLDKLPPQQRRAYTLHKIEGKSYKEIAEIMQISASTINKHIHYATKFINRELNASPWVLHGLIASLFSTF